MRTLIICVIALVVITFAIPAAAKPMVIYQPAGKDAPAKYLYIEVSDMLKSPDRPANDDYDIHTECYNVVIGWFKSPIKGKTPEGMGISFVGTPYWFKVGLPYSGGSNSSVCLREAYFVAGAETGERWPKTINGYFDENWGWQTITDLREMLPALEVAQRNLNKYATTNQEKAYAWVLQQMVGSIKYARFEVSFTLMAADLGNATLVKN